MEHKPHLPTETQSPSAGTVKSPLKAPSTTPGIILTFIQSETIQLDSKDTNIIKYGIFKSNNIYLSYNKVK